FGTATGTTATVTGLTPGTDYEFEVTAVTAGNVESAPSNIATATTTNVPPGPPPLGVIGTGGGDVTLFNTSDGTVIHTFTAPFTGYTGVVSVALGDLNGDGFADVICAPNGDFTGGTNLVVFDG